MIFMDGPEQLCQALRMIRNWKSISKDQCVYFRQVIVLFLRSIYRLGTLLSLLHFDSSFNKHHSLSATTLLAKAIPCKSYGCGKPNALMQEDCSKRQG